MGRGRGRELIVMRIVDIVDQSLHSWSSPLKISISTCNKSSWNGIQIFVSEANKWKLCGERRGESRWI